MCRGGEGSPPRMDGEEAPRLEASKSSARTEGPLLEEPQDPMRMKGP